MLKGIHPGGEKPKVNLLVQEPPLSGLTMERLIVLLSMVCSERLRLRLRLLFTDLDPPRAVSLTFSTAMSFSLNWLYPWSGRVKVETSLRQVK